MSDGYGLDERFELAVLHSCCSRPSFWKRVGGELDPKRMGLRMSAVILTACRRIASEVGRPPTSPLVVLQRIKRWNEEGKLKAEDVQEVADYFDKAEDRGLIAEDDLVAELVPVVRRKMHSEAVLKAHDEFSRRGDFSETKAIVEKADRLGEVVSIDDTNLTSQGMDTLDEQNEERLRTPSVELTAGLDGGLPIGGEGIVMAGPGGGKSMYLIDQTATSSLDGKHVLLATLELPQRVQFARVVANLTGVPVNEILRDPDQRKVARARLEETEGERGPVSIGEFSPHVTTVQDVIQWLDQKEQQSGRKVDVLVIDYADKLWDPRSKDGNEYVAMRYVYESLRRDVAVARKMWVWTASQSGRRGRKEKDNIDLDDVSDSMHKVRVADLVLTLNYENPDNYSETRIFVAKNRTGSSRFAVGPIATDFARARIAAKTVEPF